MGWFGKLAFGTMGLFMAGPLGAFAGAALGHHLIDKEDDIAGRLPLGGSEESRAAYFVSLFSILGKLAQADGAVSREEKKVLEDFLKGLRISEQQKQFARNIFFNESKDSPYSLDDFAEQLYRINHAQPTILLSFMDLLFRLAAADGRLHRAEEALLLRIKEIFRIGEQKFANLKSSYFNENNPDYRILNCTRQCTNDEIRSNYKKLVKEFHPDTIIPKGLPEEFVGFATKKFQEIQCAYDNIRRERGF